MYCRNAIPGPYLVITAIYKTVDSPEEKIDKASEYQGGTVFRLLFVASPDRRCSN